MTTIFHLSDLHFGTKDDSFSNKWFKFKLRPLEGHNPYVLPSLKRYLSDRIKATDGNYHIVISGDISVNGSNENFELVEKFLFEELAIDKQKLFLIPGNHDCYNSKGLDSFHRFFHSTGEYPILKTFEMLDQRYCFIGFDSTYPGNNPFKRIAKGIIETNQYEKADKFLRRNKFNFKIVVLHHNPIMGIRNMSDWSLALEDSKQFVNWVTRNDIDLVLFGHIHDDFYDFLPLKLLLKLLPKNRSISRDIKRSFIEQNILGDYESIRVNGKSIRYIDSIAYHFIRKYLISDILSPESFKSKRLLERYLHNLPQYKQFKRVFNEFPCKKTGLCMAGSACQAGQRNSFLEIKLNSKDEHSNILVYRHHFDVKQGDFQTKKANFDFT